MKSAANQLGIPVLLTVTEAAAWLGMTDVPSENRTERRTILFSRGWPPYRSGPACHGPTDYFLRSHFPRSSTSISRRSYR